MKLEIIQSPSQAISDKHVPNVKLCRSFGKKDHADQFSNGKYRFVDLLEYRKSEHKLRSDPTEQESSNFTPDGGMYGQFSSGNFYVMCFAEVNENTQSNILSEKFGEHCIVVRDNVELTNSIVSAWSNSVDKNRIAYFQWFRVIYNKNEVVYYNPLTQLDDDIHIYQKPREHTIHRIKRIRFTIEQTGALKTDDLAGPIGKVREFSSLDALQLRDFELFKNNSDWEILESETNNFEIEQEWRLVFFSDKRLHKVTKEWLPGINQKTFTLMQT